MRCRVNLRVGWPSPVFVVLAICSGCGGYDIECTSDQSTTQVESDNVPIWGGTTTTLADLVAALAGTWTGSYTYECAVADCSSGDSGGDWVSSWQPDPVFPISATGPQKSDATDACPVYLDLEAPITVDASAGDFSADGTGTIHAVVSPAKAYFEVDLDGGFAVALGSPLDPLEGPLSFTATMLVPNPLETTCVDDVAAYVSGSATQGPTLSGTFTSPHCTD